MGEKTGIAWTDHTFNIAWGCTKISPGCKNCYAETLTERFGAKASWGPQGTRRTFGEKHWREPVKWNADAQAAGTRRKVFASSMCDNFEDNPIIVGECAKLWPLIRATPHLDWLLLTKRADRIDGELPGDWRTGYPNVWLGVSIENADYVSRADHLRKIPAAVRFISYEPALGPIAHALNMEGIDWVIYGGESGAGFRAEDKQWARDVRTLCGLTGAAFFHKQSAAPRTEMGIELDGEIVRAWPISRPTPPGATNG